MKRFLLFAFIIFSIDAAAQQKEGRIVYERTMQLPVRNFTNLDPDVAKQIPKSRTDQYELLFANNQCLWQFLPRAEDEGGEQTFTGGGGGVVLRFAGGANEVSFCDFTKGTRVDQREIMDRSFVVTDSIKSVEWKMTEETKTILDHTCRKATTSRVMTRTQMSMENGEIKRTPIHDTAEVVAWFTTDIPVPIGPEYQGQLPGAILELDIANGQIVYKAQEIATQVNTKKIKAPKEGKKVTAEEFAAEREKLLAEMQENMRNGGGNFRIRMQ